MISRTKYKILKKHKKALTAVELIELNEFEARERTIVKENTKDYYKKLYQDDKPDNIKLEYEVLLKKFLIMFKKIEGIDFFIGNNKEYLDNIKAILYYFSRDNRFFGCNNLSSLSNPSFEKGLLIIGSYGNGKTSIMRVLKSLFNDTQLSFKMYTSNRIVSTFESYSETRERAGYIERTKIGRAYFDDVKTEKIASNYGRYNLMKDIIEERYINKLVTYITCNYKDGDANNDIELALLEFQEKYGARVYDRIFEMFNIIEFKGKSLRK